MTDWRPSGTLANARRRAVLLGRVREFFAARDVLEVETPVLARAAVTDVHLASLQTRIAGRREAFYLQTSPEYAMKRLLAAGWPDVWQCCKVFRDGESGTHHNPEFTMLEWYRRGFDDRALMREVAELLVELLGPVVVGEPDYLPWREAFRRELGLDPYAATTPDLVAAAHAALGDVPESLAGDREGCLDLLMGAAIGPRLGHERLVFVHDYPAAQAALARLKGGDPPVAARFEAWLGGLELCNGFHELADPGEQRRRFEADRSARAARGLPVPPADERLLAALAHGLPDCAGVALGFDRVLMLATRARAIREVLTFGVDEA